MGLRVTKGNMVVVLGLCQKWKFPKGPQKRIWESIKLHVFWSQSCSIFYYSPPPASSHFIIYQAFIGTDGVWGGEKNRNFQWENYQVILLTIQFTLTVKNVLTYVSPKQLKTVLEVIMICKTYFFLNRKYDFLLFIYFFLFRHIEIFIKKQKPWRFI